MKITDLKFEVAGTTVYALEFDSWRKGQEQMRNRVWASVYGFRDTPKEEVEAVAKMFSAAPELFKALIDLLPFAEIAAVRAGIDPDQEKDFIAARAAICKALGE